MFKTCTVNFADHIFAALKKLNKTFKLNNCTDVSLVAIPCKGVTKLLDSTEEKK